METKSNTNDITETIPILVTKDVALAILKDDTVISNIDNFGPLGWLDVASAFANYMKTADRFETLNIMMAAEIVRTAILKRAKEIVAICKSEEE